MYNINLGFNINFSADLFRAKNSSIHVGDEANLEARKREPRTLGRVNLLEEFCTILKALEVEALAYE